MKLIFLGLSLCSFSQGFGMALKQDLHAEINESKKATSLENFYKMIRYNKTGNFVRLKEVAKSIESLDEEPLKQWLKTDEGCVFLLETLRQERSFIHLPKVVSFVKIAYYMDDPNVNLWLKRYLAHNPTEKSKIEDEYLGLLLILATSDHIKYYDSLNISFTSKNAYGYTWLISAIIQNSTDAALHLLNNASTYGINENIYATDNEGRNALVHALIQIESDYSNVENDAQHPVVEALLKKGLIVPENYKGLKKYLSVH